MQISSLDDMVCFSLYTASKSVSQAYRAVLAEKDLTYPQFLVLLTLHHSPAMTVRELGAAMHLDSGTMSPLLQRLEARELLVRARTAADERVVNVSITDAGRATLTAVTGDVDGLSAAYGLELSELAPLLATLHRITANMTQLTASRRGERDLASV